MFGIAAALLPPSWSECSKEVLLQLEAVQMNAKKMKCTSHLSLPDKMFKIRASHPEINDFINSLERIYSSVNDCKQKLDNLALTKDESTLLKNKIKLYNRVAVAVSLANKAIDESTIEQCLDMFTKIEVELCNLLLRNVHGKENFGW